MNTADDKRLFVAIILQAMEDATGTPNTSLGARDIRQARLWFERAGKDFKTICTYAGMEWESVQERALAAIAKADKQRDTASNEKAQSKKQVKPPKTYDYRGEQLTIAQLSEVSGVALNTIVARLIVGWSVEKAVNAPVEPIKPRDRSSNDRNVRPQHPAYKSPYFRQPRTYEYRGMKLTMRDMADRLGTSIQSVHHRLKQGWSIERILMTPSRSKRL